MTGLHTSSSSLSFSSYSSLPASGLPSSHSYASLTAASTISFSSPSMASAILPSSTYASRLFRASTCSLCRRSSSANSSASRTIRSISSWLILRSSPEMVIFSDLPVALSAASTLRMPFASTSNVTSICGAPLGAGAMPVRSNLPSSRLSLVMLRSPSNTWMVTVVCLSLYVVNTCVFFVGTTVLRGISLVITPPAVSRPRVSGATSRRIMLSVFLSTWPLIMLACTAAPYATASSGLTPRLGSLPPK
uniref:Uncharacterized protein n=1 Tax=Oryza punctata TaxID=4537 RepID=A0A0E0L2V4_ORYPU